MKKKYRDPRDPFVQEEMQRERNEERMQTPEFKIQALEMRVQALEEFIEAYISHQFKPFKPESLL